MNPGQTRKPRAPLLSRDTPHPTVQVTKNPIIENVENAGSLNNNHHQKITVLTRLLCVFLLLVPTEAFGLFLHPGCVFNMWSLVLQSWGHCFPRAGCLNRRMWLPDSKPPSSGGGFSCKLTSHSSCDLLTPSAPLQALEVDACVAQHRMEALPHSSPFLNLVTQGLRLVLVR